MLGANADSLILIFDFVQHFYAQNLKVLEGVEFGGIWVSFLHFADRLGSSYNDLQLALGSKL